MTTMDDPKRREKQLWDCLKPSASTFDDVKTQELKKLIGNNSNIFVLSDAELGKKQFAET